MYGVIKLQSTKLFREKYNRVQFALVVSLTQLTSYCKVKSIYLDFVNPAWVYFNQYWFFQNLLNYYIKGVLYLLRLLEIFVLFSKVCKGFCKFSIAFNKLSVEVNISKKSLYFLNIYRYQPILNGLDFKYLYCNLPRFNSISKVVDFFYIELAFFRFNQEFRVLQFLQYLIYIFLVFIQRF